MPDYPVPADEEERIAALKALGILDTPPSPALDRLTRIAAQVCQAPIALVSLVDSERQWFKSRFGLETPQTPRHLAFCAHTILGDAPLIVTEARADPRFMENKLVTGDLALRGYCGVPLHGPSGHRLGTLCVLHTREPKTLSPKQLTALQDIAELVEIEIAQNARVGASAAPAHFGTDYGRAVTELMSEGLVIQEQSGQIIYANKAACEILGLDATEVLGRSSRDPRFNTLRRDGSYYPGAEHPAWLALKEGVETKGEVMGIEQPSGDRRWIEIHSKPFYPTGESGERQAITTFRDITEQTKAHVRLEAATTAAEMGIWEVDCATQEIFWDDRMLAIYGATRDMFRGRVEDWRRFLLPEDEDQLRAIFREQIRDRRQIDSQFRIRRPDGEIRHLRVWGRVVGDLGTGSIIGTARDETQEVMATETMRLAREAADSANKAKSEFLAAMSHEIRTPMNGVLGMARALSATALDENQREMVQVIDGSGRNLMKIIDNILDLSKVEAGRIDLVEAPFDLHAMLSDSIKLFAPTAAEKCIDLHLSVAPKVEGVYLGDNVRLRQVLDNLVSNALKFTEIGSVELRAELREGERRQSPEVVFSVSDTGIGLTEEEQTRLFQEFSQADAGISRKYGGTGLGLALARQLVELMGGWIGVESAKEAGSVFRFGIPLRRALKERSPTVEKKGPPLRRDDQSKKGILPPSRVLVAEDNEVNRRVLKALLSDEPLDMTMAYDGNEAIEFWRTGRYDLILMDVQMPVTDGIAAARQIRCEEAARGAGHIPIIALTANAMSEQIKDYLAHGFDDHIAKPIDPAELLIKLQIALTSPLRLATADGAAGRA